MPNLFAGKGKHRFSGRFANRAAGAFRNDESGRERPIPCQGQRRNRQHIDDITDDRDEPVLARTVADQSSDGAKAVADQFAKSRRETDDCGTRTERCQEWASDAPRAFIGHVGETIRDA